MGQWGKLDLRICAAREASWKCSSEPERALACARSTERCDCGAAWNQFECISSPVYLLRFPKLKCPLAVSVAEIPADVMTW